MFNQPPHVATAIVSGCRHVHQISNMRQIDIVQPPVDIIPLHGYSCLHVSCCNCCNGCICAQQEARCMWARIGPRTRRGTRSVRANQPLHGCPMYRCREPSACWARCLAAALCGAMRAAGCHAHRVPLNVSRGSFRWTIFTTSGWSTYCTKTRSSSSSSNTLTKITCCTQVSVAHCNGYRRLLTGLQTCQ